MFKSLRTSTKLLLLCGVFVGALVVATYGLVAEKQIAINFVRKELVGVQHLEALRGVYAAILTFGERGSTSEEATAAPQAPISGAREAVSTADQALRRGDWTTFGRAWEQLKSLLER
jgi:hypothetical protein